MTGNNQPAKRATPRPAALDDEALAQVTGGDLQPQFLGGVTVGAANGSLQDGRYVVTVRSGAK